MTAEAVTVTLVNVSPTEARTVTIQAGAYGEHQIGRVRSEAVADGGAERSEELLDHHGEP